MKKPFVFISYSTKDQETANLVHSYLEGKGIPCWIASRNIEGGESFARLILSTIRDPACMVFVMVASQNSNSSGHVSNELAFAFKDEKKIIPFLIESFEFSDDNMYHLVRAQWIEAFNNMNEGLKHLLAAVRAVIPAEAAPAEEAASPVYLEVKREEEKKNATDVQVRL